MEHSARDETEERGNCQLTRRHAQEFLDGELEDSIATVITVHVADCQRCGKRITFEAAFLRTISRGRQTAGPRLPAAVEERVVSLLREWSKGDA